MSAAAVGDLSNVSDLLIGQGVIYGDGSNHQLAALYITVGQGVATGLPANLSTALSSFAAYMKGQTGTQHARGLWLPGCTLDLAGDPRMAPKVTDKRETESPTGVTLSLRSTHKLEHNRLQWSHVTIDHVRESSAPYARGSWEWFLDETQFGLGSSWFPVESLIQIYDHVGNRVGEDADVAGWAMHGVPSFESTANLVIPGYTGLWDIHIPRLVAEGG